MGRGHPADNLEFVELVHPQEPLLDHHHVLPVLVLLLRHQLVETLREWERWNRRTCPLPMAAPPTPNPQMK